MEYFSKLFGPALLAFLLLAIFGFLRGMKRHNGQPANAKDAIGKGLKTPFGTRGMRMAFFALTAVFVFIFNFSGASDFIFRYGDESAKHARYSYAMKPTAQRIHNLFEYRRWKHSPKDVQRYYQSTVKVRDNSGRLVHVTGDSDTLSAGSALVISLLGLFGSFLYGRPKAAAGGGGHGH